MRPKEGHKVSIIFTLECHDGHPSGSKEQLVIGQGVNDRVVSEASPAI